MFCLFKYFYPSHSPLGFVISVSFSVLCNSSVNSVDLWTLWEKEMFSPFLVYYLINNYSFLSRQLVQIFVHPKSWQRYLELFYPFFKLPFSYPSHPLLLFPLLFCLLFKLPFSYPFHPLQQSPLLFCLLFILSLTSPTQSSLLFFLLLCLLFILSLTSPTQPSLLFPSVTLSPLTLSLFHFFVALSHRCFSLLFLLYESIFSSSVDLIFFLYSIPIVYYKTIYLCLYLYIFSRYYLSI